MTTRVRELAVYMQLARKQNYSSSGGDMTIVSTGIAPPQVRKPKSVLVKLRLRVPDAAFDPAMIPALLADIPLDMLHPAQPELEVVVDDVNNN